MSHRVPHIVLLVLGDWSNDGHGMSETIPFCTEYTSAEIAGFVEKAEEKLGIKIDDIASEYDEPWVYEGTHKVLVLHNVIGESDLDPFDDTKDRYYLGPREYTQIYLNMAIIGNEGKSVGEVLKLDKLEIGGYGLFSH